MVESKQYDPTRQTAVGDLNSDAKGSGARDNAGKARADLLTWLDAAELMGGTEVPTQCMLHLGSFQETHDPRRLITLVEVLYAGDMELALREAAAVFEFGAKKYKAWNWFKGMPWSVPVGCIGRHLLAMHRGEESDPDSKLPHAGHVVCNVFMLMAYARTYREGNDLPPRSEAPLGFGSGLNRIPFPTAAVQGYGQARGAWKEFTAASPIDPGGSSKSAEATEHQVQGAPAFRFVPKKNRRDCPNLVLHGDIGKGCTLTIGHVGDCE